MSAVCLPTGDVCISIKIEESDLYGGIFQLLKEIRPDWNPENIKFKVFTDGITNKLIACRLCQNQDNNDDVVLVRIYGNNTDLLIDRTAEIRNIKVLHALGLAPEIYGIFENGLAYQYYPGAPLTTESVFDAKIWPLVARQMAKMHKVKLGLEVKQEPVLWDKAEQFLSLIPERFTDETKQKRFVNSLGSITKLRIEFERLKSHLTKAESPVVFAHNDLVLGNVIYNQSEGIVVFIDYEYAAYNYQAYDIANHFNEYVGLTIEDIDYNRYPNKDFQENWVRVYLAEYMENETPTESDVQKVYREVQRLTLASHFSWGVWSLVQYEHSTIDFDFGRYAEIRLNRYYEIKDKILKEFS